MPSAPRARSLALAVCVALAAASARASAATPADEATAKAAIREARALREKGDLAGARDQLKAAWALVPTPRNGVELAETHEALGELVEARAIYVTVTTLPPYAGESKESLAARAKAEERAIALATRIPSLRVKLEHVPAGATVLVSIDGEPIAMAAIAAARVVNPGMHVVRVEVVGARAQTTTIVIEEGKSDAVSFDLTPPPPATKPVEAPPPQPPIARAPIVVVASPAPSDARPSGLSRSVGFVGIVTGVVGVGVGAGLGLSARSSYDSVKSAHCPTGACDPAGISGISDAQSRGTTATIVFGAGALLAIGGGVLWLTSRPGDGSTSGDGRARITSIGLGLDGLVLGGSF